MKGKEESKAPFGELVQNCACGVHEAVLVVLPAETELGWAGACPVFDSSTCTVFKDLFPHSVLLWLRGCVGLGWCLEKQVRAGNVLKHTHKFYLVFFSFFGIPH